MENNRNTPAKLAGQFAVRSTRFPNRNAGCAGDLMAGLEQSISQSSTEFRQLIRNEIRDRQALLRRWGFWLPELSDEQRQRVEARVLKQLGTVNRDELTLRDLQSFVEDALQREQTEVEKMARDLEPMLNALAPSREKWQTLTSMSHFLTAVAIKEALQVGNYAKATTGIEELIDSLSKQARREMRSQLVRLMTHVIKWKSQPERRSKSWVLTILNARDEIDEIREETPSITEAVIRETWDRCFVKATRNAEYQMRRRATVAELSWDDLFKADYRLPDEP
jgi:hypothetical protein